MLTQKLINFIEEISKYKTYRVVDKHLKNYGFDICGFGASAVVYRKGNIVLKLGDAMDNVPRSNSKFFPDYLHPLYTSENKKIRVQPYVRLSTSYKALYMLVNKYKLTSWYLCSNYDIRWGNVALYKGRPVIIDWRNWKLNKKFSKWPTWHGKFTPNKPRNL